MHIYMQIYLVKLQLKTEIIQKSAMRRNTGTAKSQVQNSYFIQKKNMTRGTSHCESLKKM